MHINKLNSLFFLFTIYIFSSCNISNQNINYRNKNIEKSIYDYNYKIGKWEHPNYISPFSFNGNHRVVIGLDSPSDDIHQVIIPWRRRDNILIKKI